MPVFHVPNDALHPLSRTFIYHLCLYSMFLTIHYILITYLSARDRALASCCCSTSQPSFNFVNPAQRWPQTSIERAPSGNKIISLKQETYFHGAQPFLRWSKKFSKFQRLQRFITVLQTACQLSLSWARLIWSKPATIQKTSKYDL